MPACIVCCRPASSLIMTAGDKSGCEGVSTFDSAEEKQQQELTYRLKSLAITQTHYCNVQGK
ncbi:Hypothetical predicted protein [Pelobates cultripes]|uniref:Uncharacterized protein n=1 Tax=Pelobates cultripes TaxID=61616 RepID=A0AAD1WGS9_PELCU|nr:Hypothetical predicted protein [Pelobates cultripes]